MKRYTLILLALLALVARSRADDWDALAARYAVTGDASVLYWFGDSWSCNAQIDGETARWGGSDEVGNTAPYLYLDLWADPTTTHGSVPANQLAYRLKTRKVATEAIGGASLGDLGSPFAFEQDSSIAGWIDNLPLAGGPVADYAVLYGGINNELGADPPSWAELRPMFIGAAKRLIDTHSSHRTRYLIPTLQPCCKEPLKWKIHSAHGFGALTWAQTFDHCVYQQALQDTTNTFLLDTLKIELADAGYDTSRVFVPDVYSWLVEPLAWTGAGDPAADYPLDLGGLGTPTQQDSIDYAAIRFARTEIENDSIHVNLLGLRQIGDSMAVNCFGIDLGTWTPGASATLYVDKARGDNWDNRLTCTSPSTPLATVQAAIFRAWPGDEIRIVGTGNQALIWQGETDDDNVNGQAVNVSEFRVTRPDLTIVGTDACWFDGIYNSTDGKGLSFIDWDLSSAGDGMELPPSIYPLAWPASPTAGVDYPRLDMGLTIQGLRIEGYQNGFRVYNASDVTLSGCTIKGGGATSPAGAITWFNYGDTLDVTIEDCTFYPDSNSVAGTVGATAFGRLNFNPTVATGDSTRFTGRISGCSFLGDSTGTAATNFLYGWWDGIEIVDNLYDDPYSGNSAICYVTPARPSGVALSPLKMVNNEFRVSTYTWTNMVQCTTGSTTTDSDGDTLIFVNNRFVDEGGEQPGSSVATLRWPVGTGYSLWSVSGNVLPSTSCVAKSVATTTPITQATLVTNGATPSATLHGRNWGLRETAGYSVSDDSDIVRWGGVVDVARAAWDDYPLTDFGLTPSVNQASIGPVQRTAPPWISAAPRADMEAGARVESIWEALSLIDSGVLPSSDSLDVSTFLQVPAPTSAAEELRMQLLVTDPYNLWPAANRQKLRLTVR